MRTKVKKLWSRKASSLNGKAPKIEPKEPVAASTAKFRRHGGQMDFSEGTPEEIEKERIEAKKK